jgi:AcrR family transcriptional regulator
MNAPAWRNSARVGGSKATLYSYFKSKEELFAAAMMDAMEDQGLEVMALLDPSRHGRSAAPLAGPIWRWSPRPMCWPSPAPPWPKATMASWARRCLPPGRGAAGAWWLITWPGRRRWAGCARATRLMAAQLTGLIEAGFVEPLLFGAPMEFDPEAAVEVAVEAFCAPGARSPDRSGPPRPKPTPRKSAPRARIGTATAAAPALHIGNGM